MATGILKFFDATKGFGFIIPDEAGPDLFLHVSAVKRSGIERLVEGDPISFEKTLSRSGKPCADNISIPSPTN